MRLMKDRLLVVSAMLLSLFLLSLTTFAADNFGDFPDIVIQAHDFSFENPAQIETGFVHITMMNDGAEPHHAQIAKLREGVTMESLQQALETSPEASIPLLEFVGGPSTAMPGESSEVYLYLEVGQYVLLCFVAGEDQILHLAKGMIGSFEVVPLAQARDNVEPEASVTVNMVDFGFEMPSEVPMGRQVWHVVNNGEQPHEMAVIKLAEGARLETLQAWMTTFEGPPPYTDMGGMQALDHGLSGWAILDLEPGTYVALCFVPDPASGKPHVELGMISEFAVIDPSQPTRPVEPVVPTTPDAPLNPVTQTPSLLIPLLLVVLAILAIFLLKR